MKTTHFRQGLIGLLFVATVLSCIDHRVPVVSPGSESTRLRVKTIKQETPNNPTRISAFKYDSQGRLSLIVAYQAPDSSIAPVENSIYQYDTQNRLTQLRREIVRRSGSSPNPIETYYYSYNVAGQVSGIGLNTNYSGGSTGWSVIPQYNSSNLLVGNSSSYSIPGVSITGSSMFTFTGNNLTLITQTSTFFRNTPVTSTSSTTFTFDTNVNPFYGVFVIPNPTGFANPPSADLRNNTYYGGIGNVLNLSQNNVLSDGTSTYNYAYNSANLPTIRIKSNGGTPVETLYYEYESY